MRLLLTRAGSGLALLVMGTCALLFLANIWREPFHLQWDFHTYYYASAAQAAGLDPYDPASISQVSNKRWTPAFLYPPLTLHLFSVFRTLDYPVAARVWLVLKLVLAGVLVLQWHRLFTRLAPFAVFAVFLCFALGATFAWDLKAGNISIVEQFLLWTAFGCLLRDRPRAFCVLLLAASLFKLSFLAFLPLLLLFDQKRKWLCLGVTTTAMAVYLLANHLAAPDQFAQYVRQAIRMNDLGSRYNSGLLAFLKDAADGGPGAVPLLGYVAIVALSVPLAVRRLGPALPTLIADRPLAICLACAIYAAFMPRMKSYSYIILVLPSFLVVMRSIRPRPLALSMSMLALLALPIRAPFALSVWAPFAAGTPGALVKDYWLLGLAWLVLALLLRHVRSTPAPA
ncbi:MAG: DUF2029 domain-containing protein [bacterium]|nr:DUF2029 domain-containing protein [bacterium]MBK7670372.1 DUF2029 domain-containing protein [bacterium]